jgi:hypothetical protein
MRKAPRGGPVTSGSPGRGQGRQPSLIHTLRPAPPQHSRPVCGRPERRQHGLPRRAPDPADPVPDRGAKPESMPDRSKLFGSHGQRPCLHNVVMASGGRRRQPSQARNDSGSLGLFCNSKVFRRKSSRDNTLWKPRPFGLRHCHQTSCGYCGTTLLTPDFTGAVSTRSGMASPNRPSRSRWT